MIQQVRGEGMPECMGREFFLNAGRCSKLPETVPERLPRHGNAAIAGKDHILSKIVF